jgi:hypothetical protein
MHRLGGGERTVVPEPDRIVRQVLFERPAEVDVEDLHAVADREHGDVTLERKVEQSPLVLVPAVVDVTRRAVTAPAVEARIDVSATRQQEPGRSVEGGRVVRIAFLEEGDADRHLVVGEVERGEDDRVPPGGLDRPRVRRRDPTLSLSPLPDDHNVAVAAVTSPDHRFLHAMLFTSSPRTRTEGLR